MLAVSWDTIRLFLHVLAAATWVGGQLVWPRSSGPRGGVLLADLTSAAKRRTIWLHDTADEGEAAMSDDLFPVRWAGRQAVVTFPAHIGVSNASQLSDRLLAVINRGAEVLVGDLTGTLSCDHSAVAAMARACQRAAIGGTRVQLVVTAPAVRRVLAIEEVDRLVPIYPSLEAATAAGRDPGSTGDLPRSTRGRGQRGRRNRGQDHSGRAVAAPRRPRGWPVAGGSRRDDRPGQPAVRGDARLPARGADRPAA